MCGIFYKIVNTLHRADFIIKCFLKYIFLSLTEHNCNVRCSDDREIIRNGPRTKKFNNLD